MIAVSCRTTAVSQFQITAINQDLAHERVKIKFRKTYRELIKLLTDGRILVTLEALETVPMLIKQMHASLSLILKRSRTDDEVIDLPLVSPDPNPSAVALIRIF